MDLAFFYINSGFASREPLDGGKEMGSRYHALNCSFKNKKVSKAVYNKMQ